MPLLGANGSLNYRGRLDTQFDEGFSNGQEGRWGAGTGGDYVNF